MEKLILHIHDTHPDFSEVITLIPAIKQRGISVSVYTGLVLYIERESGNDIYKGELAVQVLRSRARSTDKLIIHTHESASFFREIHLLIPLIEQRGVSISRRVGFFLYTKGKNKDHVYGGDMAMRVLHDCVK